MEYPKIIDNDRRVFLDVLKDIAPKYNELSIATGYWDLRGTELIIDELKKFKKIRLLIGREPLIPRHKLDNPEPDYPDDDFFYDLEKLAPDEKFKNIIIDIKQLISKGIMEVRVYKKSFLHAKCYIFGNYKSEEAVGIIGSSNFTGNGLKGNAELNSLESDYRIVTFIPRFPEQEIGHLYWFDKFWNESESWEGRFREILEESPVGDLLFSPYEMYIKTLYELYGDELDTVDLKLHSIDSGYDLFDFQKQNARHLLKKLKKYKTAMLADSVGLGKTITAIEVIRNYADSPEGRKRIEIICPKALKEQWMGELSKSKVYNIEPVVLQNPKAIESKRNLDHIASVSLFVIDESHNLRKTGGKRFAEIVDWIRQNKNAHVLLLTATPINNELTDLVNQLLLGTGGRSDVITVQGSEPSMQNNFVKIMQELQKSIKQQITNNAPVDYGHIRRVISPIIRSLVVRRTRQGIKDEFGGLLINGVKRDFPETKPGVKEYTFSKDVTEHVLSAESKHADLKSIYLYDPEEIAEICTDLKHPLDQLDKIKPVKSQEDIKKESPIYFIYQLILMLGLIPYRWRIYQEKYYGKSVQEIRDMKLLSDENRNLQQQRGIYGIFRTIFLKRMESSAKALEESLTLYQKKLYIFKTAVNNNQIVGMEDVKDIEAYIRRAIGGIDEDPEEYDEDLEVALPQDLVLDVIDDVKYNTKALKNDIERDLEIVKVLLEQVKYVRENDTKITALADLLKKLDTEEKPAGQKVLVFTYFADTLYYLKDKLGSISGGLINESNAGFLASRNRAEAEVLACRFSPKSKLAEGRTDNELRYLFSTDILSEGQNLQDCGIIINYDLHWNPVRMIQRNGRINRIGTQFPSVYIYNMKPELRLDSYLRLVKRLEDKINVIKYTIGTDQTVLGEEVNPIEYVDSIAEVYSPDEMKRIKAMTDIERAGDFLLAEDSFIFDLKRFDRENTTEYKEKIYKRIANGKWGLMPRGSKKDMPQALVLSRLYSKGLQLSPEFISMDRNGDNRKSFNTLQALCCLQANKNDNLRHADRITGKSIVREKAEKLESYALVLTEIEPLKGSKREAVNILTELHYDMETITTVRDAFYTKNYLIEKELGKIVRSLIKAKNENKPYQELLSQLIDKAHEAVVEKTEVIEPDRVENILFYARDNE